MSSLLRRYRAERFPLMLVTLVPLSLVVLAGASGNPSIPVSFADLVLALLLFSQFRIVDDLADRSRDAHFHPERAFVRAASVQPVVNAGLLSAAATLGLLVLRGGPAGARPLASLPLAASIVVYLATVLVLTIWYAIRRDRTLLGDHLVLAKYPAFVWVIAKSRANSIAEGFWPGERLALAMAATYLAACIYEALHDRRSPARARPVLVLGEGLLLALTLTALSVRGLE